jgi:methyl-accepting chemotaxis protein
VGQVLGTVTVRDYLGTRLDGWKEEAGLAGGLNLVKIVIHSVILFFLLRALLGPLLSLRAAVARLAKGAGGLSTRAEVRSTDEFGELAHDLNAFLDRVDHMLRDLERTIGKMVAVASRLAQVTGQAGKQLEGVEGALYETLSSQDEAARDPVRTAADLSNLNRLLDTLDQGLEEADPADRARIAEVRGRLEAARAGWERYARMTASAPRLIHEVHGLRHMIQEIGFLEEHLADVAESGRDLLGRVLRPREVDSGETPREEARVKAT